MAFEDFERFWRIKEPGSEECAGNSIVIFDRNPETEKITLFCAEIPYGDGTGSFKEGEESTKGTIEVALKDGDYVISMGGTEEKPTITFDKKGPGPAAGSWTAEDYVPGPPPPTGE